MGDNTSIFTPSNSNDRSYQSVKRLSKYLNTLKICKNKNDTGCSDLYYPVRYAQSGHDGVFQSNNPKLILNDGSIYNIYQYDTCEAAVESCQKDKFGNCKKDENGENIKDTWNKVTCAFIYIDVNGAKGPNKFGQDNFVINIARNKVFPDYGSWVGGKTPIDIITNKI